ncbi:hypothetical protein M527_06595 [Sphingobium indicum IP26]|uniref:Uncharacterized protein n=1 Tax=Sphingobium indicum F2 TaxID=1450518 RepID=A0A8E0WU78_9SPHN|nr:hypothetical protein M527_06595 [Sphingobium indicum IP26]KER37260.1 hypothetical protein AL00_06190 [Sphingobium indicum F2]
MLAGRPFVSDDRSQYEIARELRRIRDVLEVIASVLICGVCWWMLFSGHYFPVPTGIWKFGAFATPFILSSMMLKSVRAIK